jgi:hypothetical protein
VCVANIPQNRHGAFLDSVLEELSQDMDLDVAIATACRNVRPRRLIEYGDPDAPRRVLIDGGTESSAAAVTGRLERIGRPATLEAFKVCHHGSQNNIDIPLLEHIQCSRLLVSTNGETCGHPDPAAPARIADGLIVEIQETSTG